jgi:hypothetical protein
LWDRRLFSFHSTEEYHNTLSGILFELNRCSEVEKMINEFNNQLCL